MDEEEFIENERILIDIGRRKMAHLRRQYTVKGTDAGFELLENMRITTGMIQNGKHALRGGCRCAPARQTRA